MVNVLFSEGLNAKELCAFGPTINCCRKREVRLRVSSRFLARSPCFVVTPSLCPPRSRPPVRRRHQNRHRRRPQRDHVRQPRLRGGPEAAAEAAPEGRGGGGLRVPQGSPKRWCRPGPPGGRGATGGYGHGRRDELQRRSRRRGWIVPQRHPVMACAAYLVMNVRTEYFSKLYKPNTVY
jgi:hypothetical protein